MDLKLALGSYLRERENQNQFSGVALITQRDKILFSGAYGYANRTWKVPNSLDVRFDTASMTKLFTVSAVLQLIDQDLLSIETRVMSALGIRGTKISDEVNVFHLMTHSSGIADDAEEEAGELYEELWKTKPNYAVTQTEDFLPQFIDKEPNFLPGKGCRFNNVGFILLGLLIEKITGMTYREYVRKNIFERLGMLHSDFLHMETVYPKVAEGYSPIETENGDIIEWRKNIYCYPPVGSPDSGAYVTAGDVDIFLRAILVGKLLSPELTEALLKPRVFYRDHSKYAFQLKYGYGFLFYQNMDGVTQFILGQGENPGASCKTFYYPESDIHGILLANQDYCTWPVVWKIHQLLTGDLPAR
jgi:CubicO group peptidase (beta-lactamase class C family)